MNNPKKFKKFRKLIRDPNLFFYDMFRKKVFKENSPLAKSSANINPGADTSGNQTPKLPTPSTAPLIDVMEVQRVGALEYIRKNLGAGVGPKDGCDPNSLLIWSGYLNGLITFIAALKEAMMMNVSIYTIGGAYSLTCKAEDRFDVRSICKNLNRRPDFVIEMSNPLGALYVMHMYFFDIAPNGVATVRSNRAWIRRFPLDNIDEIFSSSNSGHCTSSPIDAVYTWVNHADLDWQDQWTSSFPEEPFDPDRYTSNDELRYSLRSVNKYAPWINNIYIVSNCSQPAWLLDHSKISWIKHDEIFPDTSALPCFNSHAIEACLHRIDGLSEKFIYLNDDVILNQPCLPSDFYDETGRSLSFFEPYGMVDSATPHEEMPDYLIAAKNSKALLKQIFNNYDARNLHRHVPFALKKSVLLELEENFPSEFNTTRRAKRRSNSDINITSFLYHHFAYAKGMGVKGEVSGLIVRPNNAEAVACTDAFKYKILCFNDGNGSAENTKYKNHTRAYFNKRLAERAPWEKLSI